jgi:2-methylcitrate dehydratase PrpD
MTAQFITRPTYAEQFAKFALQARYRDFSEEHRARLKDCILDQIGVQLVGSTLPWARTVYYYAREIAKDGMCTVTGTPSRFTATEAAFVNATFGHSCELDDIGHAGAAVIPAVLAVAEQVDASGEELLAAIGVGYEVFFRLFDAIMPQVIERGFTSRSSSAFSPRRRPRAGF